MNKLLLGLIFFVSASAFGQDSTKTAAKPPLFYLYQNNYTLAMKYNDPASARAALYSMISIDPANDSIRVSLAISFFEARQYPSTILTCMDILNRRPQHVGALELSAISYEELGLKEKALTNYEKLYMATENIQTLYKLTFIQYDLKRYKECDVNIDILMKDETRDNEKILYQLSETEQKEFAMRVAILNLSGLVKKAQGDKAGAREDFNKALELAPDFIYAKTNLDELDK